MKVGYGRVFLSKTLRISRLFCPGICPGKEKVGGVIPESGCGVGVTSIFLPGQNGNGLLSCLRHLDGVLPRHLDGVLPGHLDGVLPGHLDEILTGHLDGAFIWMRHLSGWGFAWASIWMEFFYVSGYGVLPRHMDGGIWMGFCNHGILPSGGTSFDKFCPHMSIFSIVA